MTMPNNGMKKLMMMGVQDLYFYPLHFSRAFSIRFLILGTTE
jgi:hypothetical protein